MNASPLQSTKQVRLARHYLGKLRSANRAFKGGDENTLYGLKLAQQDWAQIQHWQAWATSRVSDQPEAAQICSAYSLEGGELLDLILSPHEQRVWYETGLFAARQEGDQRAELAHLLALSIAYSRLSDDPAAKDCALQALVLAEGFEDQKGLGEAALILGNLLLTRGNYAEARAYMEQSQHHFRVLKDRRALAGTLYNLGRLTFAVHDLTACHQYLDEALSLYQQVGDERGVASVLHVRRVYAIDQPTTTTVHFNIEERLRLFRQAGDRLGMSEMLQILADDSLYSGDLAASERYSRESLELHRQLGMPRLIAFNTMALGILAMLQERYAEGRDYLLESLAICRQYQLRAVASRCLMLLAFAYWGIGALDEMRVVLAEGLTLAREVAVEGIPLGVAAFAAYLLLKGQREDAAALVGLVDAYPGTAADIRMFAVGRLRRLLEDALTPETLATALEYGKTLNYDMTVDQIIAVLSS